MNNKHILVTMQEAQTPWIIFMLINAVTFVSLYLIRYGRIDSVNTYAKNYICPLVHHSAFT